ncbi:MAG: HD domain-containing protein [Anaerolineales bacterium]|nr:HD domain-containing protein [Chloroflexota bacterium]MBL6982691.1 HD domain-containing protein [Anaerolineales bacterium]
MSNPLKVLILEDRQSDVELMLHELKRAGYETEWVSVETRADFHDQLNSDWDVILSDYILPQYNGLQALTDMHESGKDFPFIIVTGSISEEVAVECMKQGATDYLIKDRLARLGSAISRAIDEKVSRLEREHAERLIFENELRYRTIFETATVSIWEEDYSAVKKTIDDLKEQGVTDFSAYSREQPQFLHEVAESIIILDVNDETVRMFGAGSRDELLGSLHKIILPEAIDILREEVVAIAEGKTYFKGETVSQTLQGERLHILITLSIPQETGDFDRVLVSMMDITERHLLEQQTQNQLRKLAALRTIDTAINASLDIKIVTDVLLEQALALLEVDAISLLTLDPHTHFLEHAGCLGFRGDMQKQLRLRLGESQAGKTALQRRMTIIPDIANSAEKLDKLEFLAGEDIAAYFAAPLIAKGQVKGVLEALHRSPMYPDQDWMDFFRNLAGLAAIAIDNITLFKDLQKSNLDLALAYDNTLEGWARALEYRDMETEGHSRRVVDLTIKIAAKFDLSEKELVHLRRGALLHDIGKMGVPDHILQKEGPLDEKEWQIMRQHPLYAIEMLSHISHLRPALDIPHYHHEKWDGSGYPRGLKGEQIPLAARIFAIVDAWDALRSDRPYREAWSEQKALDYLQSQSGQYFDPKVVDVFLGVLSEES